MHQGEFMQFEKWRIDKPNIDFMKISPICTLYKAKFLQGFCVK